MSRVLYLNQRLSHHVMITEKVRANMTDFIIKKLPYDLSSHAALERFRPDWQI